MSFGLTWTQLWERERKTREARDENEIPSLSPPVASSTRFPEHWFGSTKECRGGRNIQGEKYWGLEPWT